MNSLSAKPEPPSNPCKCPDASLLGHIRLAEPEQFERHHLPGVFFLHGCQLWRPAILDFNPNQIFP